MTPDGTPDQPKRPTTMEQLAAIGWSIDQMNEHIHSTEEALRIIKTRTPPPQVNGPKLNGGNANPEIERALNAARDALRAADNDYAKLLAIRDGAKALENIGAHGSAINALRAIAVTYSIKEADIKDAIGHGIEMVHIARTFGTPDSWAEESGTDIPVAEVHKANPEPEAKPKPRDPNDILREHGEAAVRDMLDDAVVIGGDQVKSDRGEPHTKADDGAPSKNKSNRNAAVIAAALAGIKTATTLQTMKFPLLKYIVPGLIVEGCVLLAGKPKAGKSWFSYDVALAVASGRFCLGDKKCEQGSVLYLALEDNDRRLQSRATKLLPTFAGVWPERFNFQTQWPRANEGGIEAIDQWCEAHPDARLVVIDVLAAFRAPSTNKTNAYDQDYAAVSQLQKLAARRAITIIIVHHTRKGVSEDPVEEISGTLGLGGGVDAFLILKRNGLSGTLIGRGRDIEDHDLGLQFSSDTCRWTILGEAADIQRSEQRARVLVALEEAGTTGSTISEIQGAIQLGSRNAAYMLLSRMAREGEVVRSDRGRYALPQYVSKIERKDGEVCEKPSKTHTSPHTSLSNTSNASAEPDHTSCIDFLTWALKPGRRLVRDIEASARAEGVLGESQRINKSKPLQDAKRILKVVVEREGFGPGSAVYWRLPDSPGQDHPGPRTDCDTAVQMPEPGGDSQ